MSFNQFFARLKRLCVRLDIRFIALFASIVAVPFIGLAMVGTKTTVPLRLEAARGFLIIAALPLLSLFFGVLLFVGRTWKVPVNKHRNRLLPIKNRILWVNGNDDVREAITLFLQISGYQVTSSGNPVEALILSLTGRFDLCLLGNWLPYGKESDLCNRIRQAAPLCPILFYSAAAYLQDRQRGMKAGASAYLTQPGDFDLLKNTIDGLLRTTLRKVAIAA